MSHFTLHTHTSFTVDGKEQKRSAVAIRGLREAPSSLAMVIYIDSEMCLSLAAGAKANLCLAIAPKLRQSFRKERKRTAFAFISPSYEEWNLQ